jgi:hypothetical protein
MANNEAQKRVYRVWDVQTIFSFRTRAAARMFLARLVERGEIRPLIRIGRSVFIDAEQIDRLACIGSAQPSTTLPESERAVG